jgi:hypothetical protein
MRQWLGLLLCRVGLHDLRFMWCGKDKHLESVCERCGFARRLP